MRITIAAFEQKVGKEGRRPLETIAFLFLLVGVSRFERPTTRTPSEYATRLRYTPTLRAWGLFSHIVFKVRGSSGQMAYGIWLAHYVRSIAYGPLAAARFMVRSSCSMPYTICRRASVTSELYAIEVPYANLP